MIELRPITNRDEWLEWRKPVVTASQVPALFGCHPWLTALQLYVEKSGMEIPVKDSPVMRRGRWLEPAVGKAVAEERPDWQIGPANAFFCDPEARIGATPDFLVIEPAKGEGVLQTKTRAPSVYASEWGNGEKVPFWVQLQALTEAMLTQSAWAAVAVMLVDAYAMDVKIHEIPRHPAAEAKILAAVARFWDDVEHGREPPADFALDSALIKILARHEAVPEQSIDLSGDNELPVLLEEREKLHVQMEAAKETCSKIETKLKFLMRDAAVATGLPDWRITFRTTSYKGYTVQPREQRTLRITRKNERGKI